MAKNSKTSYFYALDSDKTWVFDKSEQAQGPIYNLKDLIELVCIGKIFIELLM